MYLYSGFLFCGLMLFRSFLFPGSIVLSLFYFRHSFMRLTAFSQSSRLAKALSLT